MDIDAIEFTKILLVDDDVEYSKITGLYLESNGFNITISNDPYKALEMCKQEKYSIILLDYYMGREQLLFYKQVMLKRNLQ